jgi:hypothetical protein
MDPLKRLTGDEEAILSAYKTHNIRSGFGLTFTTFVHQLAGRPEIDVRAALNAMVGKGLLTTLPELPDYYILARDGERFFNPLA